MQGATAEPACIPGVTDAEERPPAVSGRITEPLQMYCRSFTRYPERRKEIPDTIPRRLAQSRVSRFQVRVGRCVGHDLFNARKSVSEPAIPNHHKVQKLPLTRPIFSESIGDFASGAHEF